MTKKQAINTAEFRKDNSVFFEIDKKIRRSVLDALFSKQIQSTELCIREESRLHISAKNY
jgi:hypothetical protein